MKIMSTSTYVTVHQVMKVCTVRQTPMNVPVTLVRMVEIVLTRLMVIPVHVLMATKVSSHNFQCLFQTSRDIKIHQSDVQGDTCRLFFVTVHGKSKNLIRATANAVKSLLLLIWVACRAQ